MPTNSKSSKKASPVNGAAANHEVTEVFTPLYLNTVARVAELQKNALDVAAEQTTEWLGAWKKVFSATPVNPPTFFFDLASQVMQVGVETQKSALDLMVEQSEAVAEIARQRADAYSKIAETATSVFQTTITRSVEAQKKALQFAGEKNKAIFAATKKQVGEGPVGDVVDSIERSTNTLLEAQKSILDATTKPFVQ